MKQSKSAGTISYRHLGSAEICPVNNGKESVAPGKFATLSVTGAGMTALRKRTPIILTKPFETPKKVRLPRAGEIECDEELFDRLRALRRRIADERDVPAYIIFSDATLREMARACPQNKDEFAQIGGVGQQKVKVFAEPFLAEIKRYLGTNGAVVTSSPPRSDRLLV